MLRSGSRPRLGSVIDGRDACMPPGGSMHTRDFLTQPSLHALLPYTNPEALSGAQNVIPKPVRANLAGLVSGTVRAL